MTMWASFIAAAALRAAGTVEASLADRSRVIKARGPGLVERNGLAIEGGAYRGRRESGRDDVGKARAGSEGPSWRDYVPQKGHQEAAGETDTGEPPRWLRGSGEEPADESPEERRLSSQLTGCCYDYQSYYAADMCSLYGQDCESGEGGSQHSGSGDNEDCDHDGLSFIGLSFSVNTARGNPYSYQLCDQFPMENILDRDYDYIMSMDEDGWLVGGGYKSFDYSGKMPYIDSSHTELIRTGSLDTDKGGTSIDMVYEAMESISFPPFSVFPEYLKVGGGGGSGDNGDGSSVPSGDVTLIVSIVDTYEDGSSYSTYEIMLDDLFSALYSVGGGSCMDDHDTDPHVSMARGVKFHSSTHQQQYSYNANLEVATWQAMYPKGVVIGSNGYASFPAGTRSNKQYVGYGNMYFFFDRANITRAFPPNRDLSDDESYYATLYTTTDVSSYYSSTTSINFDYSGSGDGGGDYEHDPYSWKATSAMHDETDGWDLPPNCYQEGETFFGIPLSRSSDSKLQSTGTFQDQFDFEALIDRNYTYINDFGTNHGWLVGESIGNGVGSIVDKDTAHIPIFFTGTTNPDMGGMSLADLIKVGKNIDFGTLYIKPAFVFIDGYGHIKLQFEVDTSSALAYLYNNLCKELGITWNSNSPYNSLGVYTNCASHAAGDRAEYGCGPSGSGDGGFCPQMTIAYGAKFHDADSAVAYLDECNSYVDYWRSLYPSGVAVGTSSFCPSGGCLGLFLNRYDLYNVFKPDLGGSWVEYNGGAAQPTFSPAPTYAGGCDDPRNQHLDRCFSEHTRPRLSAVVWESLGAIGQFTVFFVVFLSFTCGLSVFLAYARGRKRKGEPYSAFLMRQAKREGKNKNKRPRGRKVRGVTDLEEAMLSGRKSRSDKSRKSRGRSKSRSAREWRDGGGDEEEGSAGEDPARSIKGRSSKSRSKSRPSNSRSKSRSKPGGREGRGVGDHYEGEGGRSRASPRGKSRSKSRSARERRGSDDDYKGEGGRRASQRGKSRSKSRSGREGRGGDDAGRSMSRSRSKRRSESRGRDHDDAEDEARTAHLSKGRSKSRSRSKSKSRYPRNR